MIYVSPMHVSLRSKRWPYRHHCYLIADSIEELHSFACKIGLHKNWFQGNHYDLTFGMKAAACPCGAKEISNRELIKKLRQ